MAINISRLNMDLKFAQHEFGKGNVFWPKDGSWVKINRFKLPRNFIYEFTEILILVPENYGYGGCWRHIFITPWLELMDKDGKTCRKLDSDIHGFKEFPYSSMSKQMKEILKNNEWFYLCLHDLNPKSSLTNYLDKVSLFLGNPYKDWKSIEKYWRQES